MRLSRTSPCYHSRKWPAIDTPIFGKSRLNCNQYFVINYNEKLSQASATTCLDYPTGLFVCFQALAAKRPLRVSPYSRTSRKRPPKLPASYPGQLALYELPAWQVTTHLKSPRTTGNEGVEMKVSQACNWSKSWLHPWLVPLINGKHWLNFAKGKNLPVKP